MAALAAMALALVAMVPGALAKTSSPGPAVVGLPTTQSLLLTLGADQATLTANRASTTRYTLRLLGTDRSTLWFTDRPTHRAGHIPTSDFLTSWRALGLAASPPNAVLVAGRAGRGDGIALELRLRSHSRTGAVFDARRLATSKRALPKRVADPTLFIDNVVTNGGCVAGTMQLFAAHGPNGGLPSGYLPANGSLQNIQDYLPLYALIGNQFGGTPGQSFGLPKLAGPIPNTLWGICASQNFPSNQDSCATGEVDWFPGWSPVGSQFTGWHAADGSSVDLGTYGRLGYLSGADQGATSMTLPNVPALAANVNAFVCLQSNNQGPYYAQSLYPFYGEMQMFTWVGPNPPAPFTRDQYTPAYGGTLPLGNNQALYAVIGNTFGGSVDVSNGTGTIGLPNFTGLTAANALWTIATNNAVFPDYP